MRIVAKLLYHLLTGKQILAYATIAVYSLLDSFLSSHSSNSIDVSNDD